jgi:DNA-binding NarL/FixJ family response regulator
MGVDLLVPREREVLELLASGLTDRGIARSLYLSQKTVEHYISRVYCKLGLSARRYDNRRVQATICWIATVTSSDASPRDSAALVDGHPGHGSR